MAKKAKAQRKQLNIGLTLEQYQLVLCAAQEAEITVTEFCREAILQASEPQETEAGPEGQIIPAWLVALLLFLRSGRATKQA